ncbi:liprin-beta-2 isoform X1 [Boleophthalmus pectinirostris]|uniref:liprin-beta-2 isoform X1 n=2 Tax=Boleophthalmus pectinirostris TaxID=150288 RepID=UPI00242CB482|nr:liprin-beta-2 isoform X1 [Boleophthalmus pectinirostris]
MEYNIDFYRHFAWLRKVNLQSAGSAESYQERLSRLEGDKESLILQVSVLTDQVEAQGVKISDLESSLEEHQLKLNSTEEMLQQELVHRASLEKQKLSLMGEVSYLKLKLADMEGKHRDSSDRQHKAESVVNFISELQEQMCRFQKEINNKIQEKKAQEFPVSSSPEALPEGQSPHMGPSRDRTPGQRRRPEGPRRAQAPVGQGSPLMQQQCHCGGQSGLLKELKILKDKVEHLEEQKLQYEKKLKATKAEMSSLQQLLISKNAEIQSLHTQLLSRPGPANDYEEKEDLYRKRLNIKHVELQKLRGGMKTLIVANEEKDRRIEELTLLLNQCKFRETPHSTRQAPPAVYSSLNGRTSSISSEEERTADLASVHSEDLKSEVSTNSSSSQQTSLGSVHKDDVSRTEPLPSSNVSTISQKSAQSDSQNKMEVNSMESSSSELQKSPDGSVDGDSVQKKTDKTEESLSVHSGTSSQTGHRTVGSPEYMKNNRSFKRFWGKLRRTQSGGFQAGDSELSVFQRGGLRATAGPRLTRTPESHDYPRDMSTPFGQWSREQVCSWLEDSGLGHYINLTRQWIENGQTLLSATPHDLEKEMGMKNPLHRKKLQLALNAFSTKTIEKSSELDHIWVTRWLDDIGLPQYKDQFHEARVDGRVLQYLTVNDLLILKVTSQLHHLSIKCAIHVLHVNKFNPSCLRRRPGDEKQSSPSEVVQWSNHRVMEWLRAVDLAEYAPNLRGSGVHGGLIILEPRFTAETLALLLNIPPQKTLLRRHLASAFSTLVGPQAAQEKREYGNATGHMPLTTTAKVKPKKLGFTQFSHLRKRKPDDSAEYICPIDTSAHTMNGHSRPPAADRGVSPSSERRGPNGIKPSG